MKTSYLKPSAMTLLSRIVEIHQPAIGAAVAVAGLDVQGGAAVFEDGEQVQGLVLVRLRRLRRRAAAAAAETVAGPQAP